MTTLIVIRHAIAEDRLRFAVRCQGPDSRRPLTKKGRTRMAHGALGLRGMVPFIGLLATSPWVRAWQTAEIVAKAYGGLNVVKTNALIPGDDPEPLLAWLRQCRTNDPIGLVGHEPHLGDWVGWALTGDLRTPLAMKKGGACALRFDHGLRPGAARLAWFMAPRELRRLGEGGPLENGSPLAD